MPVFISVINRMVVKNQIKWHLVLELFHYVFSIFLPSSHSLLACNIIQNSATSSHRPHHIIRLIHPSSNIYNIINCSVYGICFPHLHLPKLIIHILTWYHGRTIYSLLYDITGKTTLLDKLNQPFKYTKTRIKNYIPISRKIALCCTQQ